MTISEKLLQRLNELEAILKSTKELEKRQRSNIRSHFQKERLIASLRATTYVMMYNALEEAMRSILRSIREKIEAENISFVEVDQYWRLDLVQSAFLEKRKSGTNHGNLLVELIPLTSASLVWDDTKKDRLPFSGNFGQSSALKFKDELSLAWSAPAHTLGGSDLENVRERRNALAHGLESFGEAGSKTTTDDLLDTLKRVRVFMISYVQALEQYRDNKGYLKPTPEGPHNASAPAGIPGSGEAEPLHTDA